MTSIALKLTCLALTLACTCTAQADYVFADLVSTVAHVDTTVSDHRAEGQATAAAFGSVVKTQRQLTSTEVNSPDAATGRGINGQAWTNFFVHGVSPATSIKFHWVLSGTWGAVIDDSSYQVHAIAYGDSPAKLETVSFGGLSFVDGPPAQGDFAGSATGTVVRGGAGNGIPVETPYEWNGQGAIEFDIEGLYSEDSAGAFGFQLSVDGANFFANYSFTLASVSTAGASPSGAYLLFANGERLDVTHAPGALPEPSTAWLTGLTLLVLLRARSSRR